MKSKLVVTLCLVALAGCSNNTRLALMTRSGEVRVDRTPTANHDYTVTVRNVYEAGYDADIQQDRNTMALSAMKGECPNGKVVGEDFIKVGEQPDARRRGDFKIFVKCQPA